MRTILAALLLGTIFLSGCATVFTGIYWIKSSTSEPSASMQLQESVAVRDAFTSAARAAGFSIVENGSKSGVSLLPGLSATIPPGGLMPPYRGMKGSSAQVVLSATFVYPYSIAIRDGTNTTESELVRKVRQLMEDELAKVKPSLVVTFRADKIRLD